MKSLLKNSALTITAGLALLLINQACTESKGGNAAIPKTSEPTPVRVMLLEKGVMESAIHTSGRIYTDDETTLGFKIGGVVRNVLVSEGNAVRKGQVLATLDLTEIDASVSQAKIGFEKAERDLKRAQNLYRDSVATLEQLQNVQTAYEVAQQQLKAVIFNRNFAEIRAPFNGFVLKKFVNPGQVVGIGDPVLKTNGAGRGNWIIKTGVSDKQWAVIALNDKALIHVDAIENEEFTGKVIRKSEISDPATGAFTVEIAINPSKQKLASGMFGSVTIISGKKLTSWSLPYDAVLEANGDEGFVFITNDNKVAVKTPVTIGSFDNETIQVTTGLEDARSLIVAGSAYLTDQSPIIIVK
jgi:RND family efflux transporter MFP subunit